MTNFAPRLQAQGLKQTEARVLVCSQQTRELISVPKTFKHSNNLRDLW